MQIFKGWPALIECMVTFCVMWWCSSDSALAQVSVPRTIDALRSIVQKQEQALRFIRVHTTVTSVKRLDGREEPSEIIVDVTQEADPAGRFLKDFALLTGRDASRWFQDSLVEGYNGSIAWTLRRSTQNMGVDDRPVSLKAGTVTAGRPAIGAGAYSGWAATLPGFYEDRGRWFSEALDIGDAPFELCSDEKTGDVVLSCVSKSTGTTDRWLLAQKWHYCLKKYESILASGVVAWRKEVLEAQQVAPIFWYPVRVQNERFSSDGTKESTSISDMDVKVLSDLEDSVFAPMFPSGAIVTDHITGQVLRVAGPDGDVEAHLAHQVKSMKELADYGATAISFWLWWMVLIIVMSTGALMMWRRRAGQARRQSHSSRRVAPFVLPFMLGANVIAAVPAQEPWVMSVLPDTKVDNSAIGVLVMVNGYFDQSVKVRDAAALLDSGIGRTKASSLIQLRRVLENQRLRCDAVRHANMHSLIAAVRAAKGVGIVEVDDGQPSPGYVVVAPSKRGAIISRPMVGTWDCAPEDREFRKVEVASKGMSLLVRPGVREWCWAIDRDVEYQAYVGTLEPTSSVFEVPVRNGGTGDLSLLSYHSSCGCVSGVELDPVRLASLSSGVLRIRLDATRLSSSGAVQSVDLVLGCGIDKMVRRLFVAAGTRAEVPLAQASVVPSLAIAEVVTSGQCEALVSVIVPNGGLVAAVRGDPGVVAESSSLVAIEGGIAVRYRIRWSGCGAVAQFVVRSHDGRDTALHCDLRAPGVSRR
jgi:hypothetical protein